MCEKLESKLERVAMCWKIYPQSFWVKTLWLSGYILQALATLSNMKDSQNILTRACQHECVDSKWLNAIHAVFSSFLSHFKCEARITAEVGMSHNGASSLSVRLLTDGVNALKTRHKAVLQWLFHHLAYFCARYTSDLCQAGQEVTWKMLVNFQNKHNFIFKIK